MPLGKYSKCTGYVVGGKQTLMEKGLNPKSLPSAILELLVFLWNSKSVVIAKPKRPNRILELQRTRSHLLSKQVSLHCASWVFTFKSEDMSTVGQYGSDGFEFLYFSFVSNQHLCVYDQTPQKDFTSIAFGHRTCQDMQRLLLYSLWLPAPPSFYISPIQPFQKMFYEPSSEFSTHLTGSE